MTNALATVSFDQNLPIGNLDAYCRYVNQTPMLSKEEEFALASRLQTQGDVDAARQLVLSHLRFVVRIARDFNGYGLALGDLIQEGNIGLMKAVKRFDPTVGVRLASFAVHWIKSEIHDFVIKNWRIVKVATTKAQRKLFFNLRKSKKRLGWFTQDEIQNVATELGVSTSEVERMEMRLNAQDATFDAQTNDDDNQYAPQHYLEDKRSNPERMFEQDNLANSRALQLRKALDQLDERSQIIIKERWLTEKKTNLQALAKAFSVSAERVRQLEANAIKKLHDYMQSSC